MYRVITSDYFYIICSSCSPIVYRYEPDGVLTEIQPASKDEKFSKKTFKYTASKEAYYIVKQNNKVKILVKGDIKYIAFLISRNSDKETIDLIAYFLDGSSETKTFKKLIDNIYICDLSTEIRVGWFEIGKKIVPISKFRFAKEINRFFSQIKETEIEKAESKTAIQKPTISTQLESSNMNSSVSSARVSSSISQSQIETKKD